MAAAEAAWRVRVRQRVVVAHELLRNAHQKLLLTKAFIDMPVHPSPEMPWMAVYRLKHLQAKERLTEATLELYYAVVCMEAAEILALHGGSLYLPSLPLQSIDHLGPQEAALRAALGWLRLSREVAEDACKATEWCRGHLATQIALIESFAAIPDATRIPYIQAEQTCAYHALTNVIQFTEHARGQVAIAHQFL